MYEAYASVFKERQRQTEKWGEQNHEPIAWMGILMEEVGELAEAVNETHFDNGEEARKKGGYENMRAEAVQVAAVAISFIEALDRRYGA
jgi:NTP pyrophosphatase (non-canonical NTP hydrolase)